MIVESDLHDLELEDGLSRRRNVESFDENGYMTAHLHAGSRERGRQEKVN